MGTRRLLPLVAFALAAILLVAGCSAIKSVLHRKQPSPDSTVSSYLSDWSHESWPEMRALVADPPGDFVSINQRAFEDLGVTRAAFMASPIAASGKTATVPVTESLSLRALGTWSVHTTLRLVVISRHWRVRWSPETINPSLGPGDHFAVTYTWPKRAAILASSGAVLSDQQPITVTIGLRGRYIKNAQKLAAALISAGAPSSEVTTAVSAAEANPTVFEPVFSVSRARYEQLKASLYPLPGTFFQETGGGGATNPYLAALVGSLGTITKAQLHSLGPPYDSTSMVGRTGLEESYQRQLAGTPGGSVAVAGPVATAPPATGSSGSSTTTTGAAGSPTSTTPGSTTAAGAGSTTTTTNAAPVTKTTVLWSVPSKPGQDVRTSIVPSIEKAAGSALSGEGLDAALVAINTKTDQVVAVANDAASGGFDLGLQGEDPPGSTFKVITSTAFILHGLSPSSAATCPNTIDVDGEILHNAGGEAPVTDLLQSFTESCNTAFIGLTMANLNYSSLHKAALVYDLGVTPQLGAPAFGGSVPIDAGQTDLAASAIGQGRVVVSPLDLAMVAADLDSGVVREPRLVAGAPADHAPKRALPHRIVVDLHEMMLSVVERGTAAGTGLPAGTYAKTGTAEYGSGNPLPLDAWLMGFDGHIAFAMVVIDAPGDGGPIDGPIVAKFLNSIGPNG